MRNTILLIGIIMALINTVASFIAPDYATHKMIFADLSILLTTGLLYLLYRLETAAGFKIGLTLFLGLTGLIRYICAVSSNNKFQDNYSILIFITALCFECVLIFISYTMRNK